MNTELVLRYTEASELVRDFQSNLRKGRAFVPGPSGLSERSMCTLCIEHPNGGATLRLAAEAVWISEQPGNLGTGLELLGFDAETRNGLQAFVDASLDPAPDTARARASDATATSEPLPDQPLTAAPVSAPVSSGAPSSASSSSLRNVHDRVRDMSQTERDALARHGTMPERVALERRFGSSVWEGLLQNPQLTTREVAQMAKSSSLPSSLINLIVSNAGWVADSSVRSALLQNPRLAAPQLDRILRTVSQAELVKLAEQTNVRLQVRVAAKRLIRR